MTTKEVEYLVGHPLIATCPHCKTGQSVKDWGMNKCNFIECLKEYEFKFDPELLLKIVLERMTRENIANVVKQVIAPRIQKLHDSYILVQQQ